jgi:hypothetical protein
MVVGSALMVGSSTADTDNRHQQSALIVGIVGIVGIRSAETIRALCWCRII